MENIKTEDVMKIADLSFNVDKFIDYVNNILNEVRCEYSECKNWTEKNKFKLIELDNNIHEIKEKLNVIQITLNNIDIQKINANLTSKEQEYINIIENKKQQINSEKYKTELKISIINLVSKMVNDYLKDRSRQIVVPKEQNIKSDIKKENTESKETVKENETINRDKQINTEDVMKFQ